MASAASRLREVYRERKRESIIAGNANGQCLSVKADFPEKGVTVMRCFLDLRGLRADTLEVISLLTLSCRVWPLAKPQIRRCRPPGET